MNIKVIGAVSDTHGDLPDVPSHLDILVHAGDVCPDWSRNSAWNQGQWLDSHVRAWLEDHKMPTVATWGNHDWVGMANIQPILPWTMLIDKPAEVGGLKIWGTPWTKRFSNWAFMDDEEGLDEKFRKIPADLDILIVHGPPFGHVDDGMREDGLGSKALLAHIMRAKPSIVICGHIHEAKGDSSIDHANGRRTYIHNVSMVDLTYRRYSGPPVKTIIYDLDTRQEVD